MIGRTLVPAPTSASTVSTDRWGLLAHRLAGDPYLAPIVRRWGVGAALEAGWLGDERPVSARNDDEHWLGTPTSRVRAGLDAARHQTSSGGAVGDPVVLLATGGFFPLHRGHLAMVEAARRAVERTGRVVVGGYLSPGPDRYLQRKRPVSVAPAAARVADLAAALAGSTWLDVDPWEALAGRGTVNFTEVTARLQSHLRRHVDGRIEVWFVCGADNARFSLAFAERGHCVVVGRAGHGADWERWRSDDRVVAAGRTLFVPGDRGESSSALPPPPPAPAPHRVRLRLEDRRAVHTLGLDDAAWGAFQDRLVARLGLHLDVVATRVPQPGASLTSLTPPVDGFVAHPAATEPTGRTISLDPYVRGTVDLAVSRLYDLGGHRFLGHVARPDRPPVAEQVAGLAPGAWTLVDDDTATGGTIAFVTAGLPPGVVVSATRPVTVGGPGEEIADSRDFLLGTDDGGLVVALPDGTIGRAPYLLPFVDPSARAGVPAHAAGAFSRDLWDVNGSLFAPTALRVADLPAPTRRTMLAAGHPDERFLADLCARHARALDDRPR